MKIKKRIVKIKIQLVQVKKTHIYKTTWVFGSTSEGTRTPDQLIKSQLLYQLSYGCGSNYVK